MVLLFGVQYELLDIREKPRATDDNSFQANEKIDDVNSTQMWKCKSGIFIVNIIPNAPATWYKSYNNFF